MADVMEDFRSIAILWDGSRDRSLLDDVMTPTVQGAGELHGHFVFAAKNTTLAEQVTALATAVGIQAWIEKEPMLSIFLAVTLLAIVSPVDLRILDDIAGKHLEIIQKQSRSYVVRKRAVKALLSDGSIAEESIEKLVSAGLIRKADNGDLIVQRRILSNIRISRKP